MDDEMTVDFDDENFEENSETAVENGGSVTTVDKSLKEDNNSTVFYNVELTEFGGQPSFKLTISPNGNNPPNIGELNKLIVRGIEKYKDNKVVYEEYRRFVERVFGISDQAFHDPEKLEDECNAVDTGLNRLQDYPKMEIQETDTVTTVDEIGGWNG